MREALVVGIAGSQVNVSVARAQRALAWRRVESLHRADVSYNATVIALADAGATVEVERLPGFVPWSHWQLPEAAWADRKALLGSRLPVKFLEVDAGRNRMVVSHRRRAVPQMRIADRCSIPTSARGGTCSDGSAASQPHSL